MQDGADDTHGDEEAKKVLPVGPGQEGEEGGNQAVAQSGEGDGNDEGYQREEVFNGTLFHTADEGEYQYYDDYNINPVHVSLPGLTYELYFFKTTLIYDLEVHYLNFALRKNNRQKKSRASDALQFLWRRPESNRGPK